jgi:hypothetical protein
MFKVEKVGTAIVIAIAVLAVFLIIVFQFRSFFDQFKPAYREAKATCENIKVGMSYDEVKAKVGSLFTTGPETHVDDQGNGQVWLVNSVKSTQVACNIRIEKGHVTFSGLMNEGAF